MVRTSLNQFTRGQLEVRPVAALALPGSNAVRAGMSYACKNKNHAGCSGFYKPKYWEKQKCTCPCHNQRSVKYDQPTKPD